MRVERDGEVWVVSLEGVGKRIEFVKRSLSEASFVASEGSRISEVARGEVKSEVILLVDDLVQDPVADGSADSTKIKGDRRVTPLIPPSPGVEAKTSSPSLNPKLFVPPPRRDTSAELLSFRVEEIQGVPVSVDGSMDDDKDPSDLDWKTRPMRREGSKNEEERTHDVAERDEDLQQTDPRWWCREERRLGEVELREGCSGEHEGR